MGGKEVGKAVSEVEKACLVYYDGGVDIRDKKKEYQRVFNVFVAAKAVAGLTALVSGRRNNDDACQELAQVTGGDDGIWKKCLKEIKEPNNVASDMYYGDPLKCVLDTVDYDEGNPSLARDIQKYRRDFNAWYAFFDKQLRKK